MSEAAEGAGIRTTQQLKDYMEQQRAVSDKTHLPSEDELSLHPDDDGTLGNPDELVTQTSNNATPDDGTDSSSSESDPETSESESDNSGSDREATPPVKRKLPFDRKRGELSKAEISPASLDNGQDTRGLAKLQELLTRDPGTVNAIDSMLQMLKSVQSEVTAGAPTNPLPPPPPVAGPSNLPPGMSETTIYMRAVPSASPSQVQNDLGVQMNRLAVSAQDDLHNVTTPLDGEPSLTQPNPVSQLTSENLPFSSDSQLQSNQLFNTAGLDPVDDQVQVERRAAKDRTDQMILDAERRKAALEKPITGKEANSTSREVLLNRPGSNDLECDDTLYGLSVHLDDATIKSIQMGEFIEFPKLIPKDQLIPDNDCDKVDIVSKDGKPAFAPHFERDTQIYNFKRWELAFNIYAGVYVRAHPVRAPEMYEYKHTIRRASESHIWMNVYEYDKVFRRHMARNPG